MNKITRFLIFATVFLIPSYLIRFTFFGIPTNVLEILIYLTFVFYLLEKPAISWKELYKNYKIHIFSIALIFIGLILSTLTSQNYREGFGIIKGWFFDPLLFAFILINKIREEKDIKNILKTFYFSAFAVSLIALEYFLYGYLTYDGRLSAFHSSPNYLAMFLAPAIFIGVYLIKDTKNEVPSQRLVRLWRKNSILPFSLFIILFIIYLTYSYAAWISIILSLIIVALITKNISKKLILIFSLIIFIAFSTQIGNPKLKNVFSERSSLNSRLIIWESSLKILKDNLIFGIGPGNFQNKYLEYQKYFSPYPEWAVPEPHNLYLAFWLQSGLIGLIGFIILIFTWLKKTLKSVLSNQKNSLISAAFLGIILYILIHGLVDTTYWKNDLSLIFWIIFSLKENL
jgi:O-antigen ligase